MSQITEDAIEQLAVELLEAQGYRYVHGSVIAPDGESPERSSFEEVLLAGRLEQAIHKLNPHVPPLARKEALRQVRRIASPNLITNNETFHRLLTEGVNVIPF